ncbi:lactosylceramide 4-alpha-galactosyltransferase-like isoform X2 [Sitodiplosis mosellana]|uniref:lactosylceramide 4-alpha-galactosyltransferase-like isoform X2 n=1 Tax=Sitodiplosis mosellana TaxID=263140 RepID=UPI002443F7A9|nr:lactosylceramide 4-alpha-galactosyltransferase-like isoform X2 [Sitodiplosis mosellana]
MHSTKLFGPKMYYLAVIIGLLIIYTVMVNNLNTIHPLERKIKAKSPSITLTNISRQHKNINELVPLNHTTILQRRISSCYQFPDDSSGSLLADISNAKLKPSDRRSIFFLMTSCSWKGKIALKARQVCAVESAAYHNPNRTIFILFASPVDLLTNTQSETLAVLQSYKNIHIQNINLDTFVEGTLAEDFYRSGKLFASKTLIEHMSDFLRLLVLYKYGGIYLDTDVVVQKNLDELPANFLGKEAYEGKKVDGVNNARIYINL